MSFAIRLILAITAMLTVVGLIVALVVRLVMWRRPPARYLRRVARLHLVLVPLYGLLGPPLLIAMVAHWEVGTRPDERDYQGPRVDDNGVWTIQSRETLAAERRGEAQVDEAVMIRARSRARRLQAADGMRLNAYLVPARMTPPLFQVVLVHGLFRNAMELETPAAMFHALGGEVLLLEMRNHGASGRSTATFGLHEAEDVLGGVRFLRGLNHGVPVILYGISLGAAAVALAAPRVKNLGGMVLDAPMPSLQDAANNLMRVRMGLFPPYRWLSLRTVELFSGFHVSDVMPVKSVALLPSDLPVLVIGGTDDFRTPPQAVERVFSALSSPLGVKDLWILEGARHGRVWEKAPGEYRRRLQRFVKRVLDRSG